MVAGVTADRVRRRTVVLVEGVSDQVALEALAERRGRDLVAEGVCIVSMGGATNIGSFLDLLGPQGLNLGLAGLCDQGEAGVFQRGLGRAGFGSGPTRAEMESHRFYVCVDDLEDELIRSLGPAAIEEVLAVEGDLTSFRSFQQQPAQQGRSEEARLRRFLGTRSGRKIHYAAVLVHALDRARVPRPLDSLLADV